MAWRVRGHLDVVPCGQRLGPEVHPRLPDRRSGREAGVHLRELARDDAPDLLVLDGHALGGGGRRGEEGQGERAAHARSSTISWYLREVPSGM